MSTTPKLTDIQGIGLATANLLRSNSFMTVSDVAKAGAERISELPGFDESRAKSVIASALSLTQETDAPATDPSPQTGGEDSSLTQEAGAAAMSTPVSEKPTSLKKDKVNAKKKKKKKNKKKSDDKKGKKKSKPSPKKKKGKKNKKLSRKDKKKRDGKKK